MAPGHSAADASAPTAWWSCAAIVALCLAVGLQTVRSDNYFLGDDFGLVQHLHDLQPGRLLSYFAADWTEGIYGKTLDELRPLLAFTYWLDARLFGVLNVSGYHTTNLILHIANALLVLAIARSIAPGEPAVALLAASWFALMPSHAEPVAWISGRVDSLAALFYLGAFLCFVRFRLAQRHTWLVATVLLFTGGLFTKQSVVTFPALILVFDLLAPGSPDSARRWSVARLWPHLLFVGLAASYLALRYTLFGNAVREDVITATVFEDFFFRQDQYGRELLPTPNKGPRWIKLLGEVLTVCVLAMCVRWLFTARQRSQPLLRRLAFFGAAWYVITIAPMAVTYSSARHLYITTAGLSIALASLLLSGDPAEERRRTRARVAMAATLIALYAVSAIWNVSTWVTSGIESQRFASAVPHLLKLVPRGSVVLLSVPEWHQDGWFWSFSTPFALQPPFTEEDFYEKFRIVERPPLYCCPPDRWWNARKPVVMTLLDSPSPQYITQIQFAANNPGSPVFKTRAIDGPDLRRQLETALGRPVETVTGTTEEARLLDQVLFE